MPPGDAELGLGELVQHWTVVVLQRARAALGAADSAAPGPPAMDQDQRAIRTGPRPRICPAFLRKRGINGGPSRSPKVRDAYRSSWHDSSLTKRRTSSLGPTTVRGPKDAVAAAETSV
jgi:hypothetical protein